MSMLGDLFEEGEDLTGCTGAGKEGSDKSKLPPPPRLPCRLSGIYNQGATCYLNSLLQTLVMTPEFRDALFRLPVSELGNLSEKDIPGTKVRVIPLQLQKLFCEMLLLDAQGVKTAELTESFGWANNEEFVQHDAQELNRILFSAIEDSLIGTSGQKIIQKLYHGIIVNQIKCQECDTVSEREEDFLDLCVTVAGLSGLEEALKSYYIETETMEGKNQYKCDTCSKLVDAEKGAKLRRLPPVLTVSLLRFSFDMVKMERFKETGKFTFPLELDMRPYCESNQEASEYELYSVVIHKGSTHGGHYHAYIRDIDNLGVWVNPDDEEIAIQSDPSTGKVEFIELDSPVDIIETLLLRNPKDGISVDRLCAELVKTTGVSWNKRFKKQYGAINKFLKTHDSKFEYYPEPNWVALRDWKCNEGGIQNKAPSIWTSKPVMVDKPNFRSRSPPPQPGHCWFDFDDSRVRPIISKQLEKQFSGKESGYMLFYRQKCLIRPADALGDPAYNLPDNLVEEVAVKNSLIDSERHEHEKKMNSITLSVHYHLFWEYHRGVIRPLQGDIISPDHRVTVDRRQSIANLVREVREVGGNFMPSTFKLHILKKLDFGYHLYNCISVNEDCKVMDTSLTDKSEIFVWNGETIGDVVYRPGELYEPIRLNVIYGYTDRVYNCYAKSLTCAQLRYSIAEITNMDPNSLLVKRVVEHEEGKKGLETLLYDYDMKTIGEIGLASDDEITVEDIYGTESSFDATRYVNQVNEPKNDNVITLKIENKCFGKMEKSTVVHDVVSIEVEKDSTVEMLKALALSLTYVGECECRLRVEDDNRGLQLPMHEDQGVLEAGLFDGARLVLEEGIPPTSSQITITFTPGDPKGDVSDMEITVDKKMLVSECIQIMCQKAGFTDPLEWHLRLTNWCGEAGPVLDDIDARLDQCDVRNGHHILLEEGRLPPKGFVRIPIYLFNTLHSIAQEEAGDDIVWKVADLSVSAGKQGDGTETRCHMGDIVISKLATLGQLKAQIMTLDSVSKNNLVIPSAGFLRISLIESDRLASVLKGSQNTLQRLKLTSNSQLGIQVLTQEEDLGINGVLLRIRTRVSGGQQYGPSVEMVWDTSKGVSPACLKQRVADALALNVERVVIAKHFLDKFEWLVITEQKQQKKGKKRQKCNLKNAPYFIKDNDVIGVKNLEFDSLDEDDFSTKADEAGKENLKRAAEEKRRKREEMRRNSSIFDAGAGGDSGGKARREVGIKIHVGDFR